MISQELGLEQAMFVFQLADQLDRLRALEQIGREAYDVLKHHGLQYTAHGKRLAEALKLDVPEPQQEGDDGA